MFKFISANVTISSVFGFLLIVKLKSLQASGLTEVFKILSTVSLQLLYACLAADIFKASDLVGKRRRLMLPLMGIFSDFL